MFRSLFVKHTISALSHLYIEDLPKPFDKSEFYINIIKNLFIDKNSSEVVNIGLIYDVSKVKNNMSIIVTPNENTKLKSIIDVDNFVKWFNQFYEELIFKYEHKTDTMKTTTYAYNDGYYRYAVVVTEALCNSVHDLILIEFKTLN